MRNLLPRDLLLVAAALLVWGIGEGMFYSFQPLYLEELGATPLEIGFITGLASVFMATVHIPAGYLADRIGRRPLMLAAWVIALAATWIMALARTLPGFIIGSVIYAMSVFVSVPMNSYITTARGKLSLSRALTLVYAIYNLGAIVGPLLGGWVGSRLGLQRNFFVAGTIFFFSTALILFIRPQPVEPKPPRRIRAEVRQIMTPAFASFLAITFLAMLALFLPQPLTVNFLQNERRLDLNQIGALISVRSLGVVLLNLILGQMSARRGFLLSQVAVGIFTALIWRGQGFTVFALGYFLGGGFQTARAFITAQGRNLLKAETMGLGYGMIETVLSTAIIAAPLLAGYLYSIRPEYVYIVSLLGIATVFLLSLFFLPAHQGGDDG